MTSSRISQIMELMQKHRIADFEFEDGQTRIHLSTAGHSAGFAPASASPDDNAIIRSPGIGRLRLAHPSLADQTPSLPRRVKQGEIVAYLAVGPMLRPVMATRDCTLRKLFSEDGAIVGYDDPLFSL